MNVLKIVLRIRLSHKVADPGGGGGDKGGGVMPSPPFVQENVFFNDQV